MRTYSRRSRFDIFDSLPVIFGAFVVLVIIAGIIFSVTSAFHVETKTGCVVEDKDRTTNSEGSSDARVYTENCGVMHVGDSLLSWQFDSADVYSDIEVGKTYDFTTRGYRVGFFSMFPNVVDVVEVG